MAELKMVFLGYGKYVRTDKIYALEPLPDYERGSGARTLVWVEGMEEPMVASRTERTLLADMGHVQSRRLRGAQDENLFS